MKLPTKKRVRDGSAARVLPRCCLCCGRRWRPVCAAKSEPDQAAWAEGGDEGVGAACCAEHAAEAAMDDYCKRSVDDHAGARFSDIASDASGVRVLANGVGMCVSVRARAGRGLCVSEWGEVWSVRVAVWARGARPRSPCARPVCGRARRMPNHEASMAVTGRVQRARDPS